MINEKRLQNTFLELVKINGKSGNEIHVADYLKSKFIALGIEYKLDNANESFGGNCGNLIGYLPNSNSKMPAIMLSAHMDTIEETKNINPIVEKDLIKTDKTTILGADDRAGVACIIEALTALKENSMDHPPVYILFSVAEEIGMHGAKNVNADEIDACCGFVFDCSAKPGQFVVKAPGSRHLIIKINGKASHAAVSPEEGISAIKVAGEAISKIEIGRILDKTTFNFGKITGGKAINIVPDYVEIEAECRSLEQELLDKKISEVKEIFETEASKVGANIEFEINEKYGPFELSDTENAVKIACEAISKTGLTPEPIAYPGGSDANVYNNKNIPTVNLGLGFKKIHSSDEYMELNNLRDTAQNALNIIQSAYNNLSK